MKVAILTTDNRENDREYTRPAPYFGTAPEALLQGFAALPEMEVHVVSCAQRAMPTPAKLAGNIWFHNLPVPKIGWMRTAYQGCVRATRRKLRELKPDIVHGQGTERDCALNAIFSGFPNVLTIHGNMRLVAEVNQARPFSYLWLAARLERFTLPRTDGVVCISRHTRDAVKSLARRTWVLPNAVDASFFDVQPAPAPDAPPVILCLGAVCRHKNQNAFIRALDPLAAKKKFRLVFLGVASDKDSYNRDFFELLQTRPWCEHAGFVAREKLKSYLREATLLALPSLEDNCPMVVLEAMAAGVPVLAAKVGGVPDLIEEDVNGIFCNPRDAESMRAGMAILLANPDLRRRLAAEGKRRARTQFHPTVIARRHGEIYRELMTILKGAPSGESRGGTRPRLPET